MSTDMIREIGKGNRQRDEIIGNRSEPRGDDRQESEAVRRLKEKAMLSNPNREAYENNIKQPAGKIFQGPYFEMLVS